MLSEKLSEATQQVFLAPLSRGGEWDKEWETEQLVKVLALVRGAVEIWAQAASWLCSSPSSPTPNIMWWAWDLDVGAGEKEWSEFIILGPGTLIFSFDLKCRDRSINTNASSNIKDNIQYL